MRTRSSLILIIALSILFLTTYLTTNSINNAINTNIFNCPITAEAAIKEINV